MIAYADNKTELTLRHKNKQVKVTLEFPENPNHRAEQEFIERMKEVYLERIEVENRQTGEPVI